MRKTGKLVSALLVICMAVSFMPPVNAGYVEDHFIDAVMDGHVRSERVYDTEYGGLSGSSAFVSISWTEIFGYDIFSEYARQLSASSDYGRLKAYVRDNARPGDILVFNGRHSVLLASVDSGGITCYETPENYKGDGVKNSVSKNTYSYDRLEELFEGADYYLLKMDDEIYSYVDGEYAGLSAPAIDLPTNAEYSGKAEVTRSSAVLVSRVRTLPGQPLDKIGLELWTSGNELVSGDFSADAEQYADGGFYYHVELDTYSDMKLSLEPGTEYKYRFFGQRGRAYYYSDFYTFKTEKAPDVDKRTITFDPNGGSVSWSALEVTRGEVIGELPVPTHKKYDFAGWYTARTGGVQVTKYDKYTWEKDITLYARWSSDMITIYLDAGEGKVSPDTVQVTRGERVGELPVPTLKGATFSGWYTEKRGGYKISSRTVLDEASSITLYARWSDESITVTFNANKGSVYPSSMEVTSEGTYGELPMPTRKGYTFDGWYTEKRGGYRVTANSKVWFDKDFTLYAHWSCGHNYKNGKCTQCGDYDRDYKGHSHHRGMHNFDKRRHDDRNRFHDVPSDAWFYDSVSKAYALGLVDGMSLTTFDPDGTLTYAQAIKIAAALHNIYYNGSTEFRQTTPWYTVYVDYALNNGIIFDDDYANFNGIISRAEFVSLLYRSLPDEALEQINSVSDYTLPDVDMDHAYAPFIYRLYRAGVLTGVDERGTFRPETSIKRCEVAAIISRMADSSLRRSFRLH